MAERLDLIGLAEIAEIAGVSRQVVANWRARYRDFPEPVANLKSGPVWRRTDFIKWTDENNVAIRSTIKTGRKEESMTRTVALVNMKGGVGKSTLTANLGWYCAYTRNMKVLLVDLDPQFNLSQYVLGPRKYEEHIKEERSTVLHIFEQFTPGAILGRSDGEINPSEVIANVEEWSDGSRIDVVPSQLELAWTLKNPHDKEQLLRDFLKDVRRHYDLILIDCPPTESMLTSAAYLASNYVLVPVRPEFLSTIGLPLLVRSLGEFRKKHKGKKIELLGVLFNATSEKVEHDRSRAFVKKTAGDEGWYIFRNEVTYSDSYAAGSRVGRPIFLTGYARSWKIKEFKAVAEEFVSRLGL